MDLLRDEAERLKKEYGPRWHAAIEASYNSAIEQMKASPGSIAIQEAMIALTYGLPSQNVKPRSRAKRARKSFGTKTPRR